MSLPTSLKEVRTLEFFEHPLLVELSAHGRSYLEKLCSVDPQTSVRTTLLIRADRRSIAEYLDGSLDLRTLVLDRGSDGVGFLVERRPGEPRGGTIVILEEHEELLPDHGVRHEPELRPTGGRSQQDVLLGGDWTGQAIGRVERDYSSAYAFNYFFAANSLPERAVPPEIYSYEYRRGFAIGAGLAKLRGNVPVRDRARSVGIAAASPGVLNIEVRADVAANLVRVARRLDLARYAFEVVHPWSTIDLDAVEAEEFDREVALSELHFLADALDIDLERLFRPETEDPDHKAILRAAKLLTSYFRLLKRIRNPAGARFVGVAEPQLIDAEDGDSDIDSLRFGEADDDLD